MSGWPYSHDHKRPSHPYNAGTKHVEFSLARQALLGRGVVVVVVVVVTVVVGGCFD